MATQVLPKLALDFTAALLDPKITFTRSGNTATVVNSSGLVAAINADLPRFDYDPVTLACKGLLIEEARTNLFTYSEQFENVAWTKTASSISADAVAAPSGATTADKLVEDGTNGAHYVSVLKAVTSGTAYTLSVFAKAGERTALTLQFVNQFAANSAVFNLSTGAITSQSGVSAASISAAGNGWYRISISATATATGSTRTVIYLTVGASVSYQGNGTSGAYIWGSQLEAGAFVTSYIPTVAASLTRNADIATITGANFSSFWAASQGGTLVQATPSTVTGVRPLVQFDDTTANEIIALQGNTTSPELYIVDDGSPQAQIDAGTIAANTAYSLTGWWALNDCKVRKDSDAVVTDTTATIPTVTQMRIGSDGTDYLNGTFATVNYYDKFSSQIYTRRKNKVIFTLM